MIRAAAILVFVLRMYAFAQSPPASATAPRIVGTPAQSELLWQKLDATIQQANRDLNGTMGVAIMDLTDGRTLLLNPDAVFTQASSIKVAVLAELYRQQQQTDQMNSKHEQQSQKLDQRQQRESQKQENRKPNDNRQHQREQ